jgi:hypothetical protein
LLCWPTFGTLISIDGPGPLPATKKKDRDHSNGQYRSNPPHIHGGASFPGDDSNLGNLLTISLTEEDWAIAMIKSQTMRKLIFWSNLSFRVHSMAAIPN